MSHLPHQERPDPAGKISPDSSSQRCRTASTQPVPLGWLLAAAERSSSEPHHRDTCLLQGQQHCCFISYCTSDLLCCVFMGHTKEICICACSLLYYRAGQGGHFQTQGVWDLHLSTLFSLPISTQDHLAPPALPAAAPQPRQGHWQHGVRCRTDCVGQTTILCRLPWVGCLLAEGLQSFTVPSSIPGWTKGGREGVRNQNSWD